MKIRITISSVDSIDRQVIDVADDDSAEVSEHIHEAIASWVLAPGDTIKIIEVN